MSLLNSNFSKLSLSVILALQFSGCTFSSKHPEVQNPPAVVAPPPAQAQVSAQVPEAHEEDLYQAYDLGQAAPPAESESKPKDTSLADVVTSNVSAAKKYWESKSEANRKGKTRASIASEKMMHSAGGMGLAPSMPSSMAYGQPYAPIDISQESYDTINENKFQQSTEKPVSTFSIDVDTASYSNVRRMITQGVKPNIDAVRIEELVNYFNYNYETPQKGAFAVNLEYAPALWNKKHKVVRVGIKGKEMATNKRPASNLVFLVDVSGSMNSPQKLPLVKASLRMLVEQMGENDKISLAVYAGAAGLALPPTTGDKKTKILAAIDNLEAGGSTNGAGGITLAYETAMENFIKGGVNRVILATDGDFNVGTTSREGLLDIVEKNAKKNVYLTILGFGMGNYKDGMMETLSNKGNGNYAYIDTQNEAKKVMVEQLSGTLVTIAKDVKIQIEFNPQLVKAYRLVGYENRLLKNEDFDNDAKDAGDIGAGHTVTALYEIVPQGVDIEPTSGESLKYQTFKKEKTIVAATENNSDELLTLKIRYKKPDGDVSEKQEFTLKNSGESFDNSSESLRFASAVALFGMLLRESEFVKEGDYATVVKTAKKSLGEDKNNYRQEFINLVNQLDIIKIPKQAHYIEE
jgi:Ca-activated chloride channel homolog